MSCAGGGCRDARLIPGGMRGEEELEAASAVGRRTRPPDWEGGARAPASDTKDERCSSCARVPTSLTGPKPLDEPALPAAGSFVPGLGS